jgi:hypothetical protein
MTMLIFFLMPMHAFLTVWGASIIGHYTALRLWKEALLALCLIGVVLLLLFDQKIRSHTLPRRLVQIILAYCLLNIIWGLLAYSEHDVTLKALGYGLISDLRYPLFFLVTWSVALRMTKLRINWQWLVIYPSIIVVVFGLLQALILPHNFLSHFGYGLNTIVPIETINNNPNYIRVFSTLRGANPLGAYLVIPITLLSVLMIRKGRNYKQALLLGGAVITLFYTFSRSAWAGAGLSVIAVLFLSHLAPKTQKIALGVLGLVIVVSGISLLNLHNDTKFQNFILHTQNHSKVASTSDQGHLSALRTGLSDLVHNVGGNGPGTAGPASIYNTGHPTRIAENYYIQIGQETGWLGLVLFLLINFGVGWLLFIRRDDPLALSLFAALIGLSLINMFSHAWADDTLAYVWWGLAGVAMVSLPEKTQEKIEKKPTNAKASKK